MVGEEQSRGGKTSREEQSGAGKVVADCETGEEADEAAKRNEQGPANEDTVGQEAVGQGGHQEVRG